MGHSWRQGRWGEEEERRGERLPGGRAEEEEEELEATEEGTDGMTMPHYGEVAGIAGGGVRESRRDGEGQAGQGREGDNGRCAAC